MFYFYHIGKKKDAFGSELHYLKLLLYHTNNLHAAADILDLFIPRPANHWDLRGSMSEGTIFPMPMKCIMEYLTILMELK